MRCVRQSNDQARLHEYRRILSLEVVRHGTKTKGSNLTTNNSAAVVPKSLCDKICRVAERQSSMKRRCSRSSQLLPAARLSISMLSNPEYFHVAAVSDQASSDQRPLNIWKRHI